MSNDPHSTFIKAVTTVGVAALLVTGVTACTTEMGREDCTSVPVVMFFDSSSGHYRYDSPKGKIVPGYKVPKSAQKVPGYKVPPGTAKPPVNMQKPAPAPAPKAPAPAPRVKTGR